MSGACLQSLPGELVDEIIQYTLPDGFESFVLSCKDIYRRARDGKIQRHNALRRRWKSTHIAVNADTHGELFSLLYELALDSLSAKYIEYLDLWDPHGTSNGMWRDIREDQEAMRRVMDMVLRSKVLLYLTELWHQMISEDQDSNDDGQPVAVVFLLSMLPNLRTLRLPQSWANLTGGVHGREVLEHAPLNWYRWLEEMVAMNQHGQDVLSNLRTILPFMPEGYDSRSALDNIEQFMPLKNLTEMYLVSSISTEPDAYTGMPFNYRPRNINWTSHLTHVELAYSCIDADGVSAFLSNIHALEVFKYSHQTKWHGLGYDWNPGTLVEALARHSGQTIKELAITVETLFGDIINGASSFFSFPKLRKLECDILIFRGPAVESGQRRGMDPYVPPGETPWDEDDIPCIGSMLPSSIEEVQLNTDFPKPDESSINALLKNCREQRAARLIRLNKFVIRQWKDDDAKPLAERAGVEFEVYNHAGDEHVIRALMPEWKREFDEKVGGVVSV
jgi:hypothetical protein